MRYPVDGNLARRPEMYDWDEQPIWEPVRRWRPHEIRRRLRRYRRRGMQWRGERPRRTRRHERR